jgi:hypothetical protein
MFEFQRRKSAGHGSSKSVRIPNYYQRVLFGEALAKQVVGCGAKQIVGASPPRFVGESADDAGGRPVKFSAYKSGGGSELVGYGFQARVQPVPMRIAAPAIIVQSLHPGDADAEIDEAFAPGTPECVADQNRDSEPGALFEFAM